MYILQHLKAYRDLLCGYKVEFQLLRALFTSKYTTFKPVLKRCCSESHLVGESRSQISFTNTNIYNEFSKERCEVTYISDFFPTSKIQEFRTASEFYYFLNKTGAVNRTFPPFVLEGVQGINYLPVRTVLICKLGIFTFSHPTKHKHKHRINPLTPN